MRRVTASPPRLCPWCRHTARVSHDGMQTGMHWGITRAFLLTMFGPHPLPERLKSFQEGTTMTKNGRSWPTGDQDGRSAGPATVP